MPGLGTIINVVFIVIGGLAGVLFGNRLSGRTRETLLLANAVAVLFIGINLLGFPVILVKIAAQILVLIGNYIISKVFVFRKRKDPA